MPSTPLLTCCAVVPGRRSSSAKQQTGTKKAKQQAPADASVTAWCKALDTMMESHVVPDGYTGEGIIKLFDELTLEMFLSETKKLGSPLSCLVLAVLQSLVSVQP